MELFWFVPCFSWQKNLPANVENCVTSEEPAWSKRPEITTFSEIKPSPFYLPSAHRADGFRSH